MTHQFEFECVEVDLLAGSMRERRFKSQRLKALQKGIVEKLEAASSPCDTMVNSHDEDN